VRHARLATLLCAAALVAAAPAALASRGEIVFFEAPGSLLDVSAAQRAHTLEQLQSLGVHALRVVLYWRDVAPKPNHRQQPHFNQANPAGYHWGHYDQLIDAAVALHWKVLLTVSGPVPNWATPYGEDRYSSPSTSDFREFMQAVGRRYGRAVKLFSIWNEPNQPGFLRPQYYGGRLASPQIYRGLFLAGYAGLRASGNFGGMTVLMGETSPVGVWSQHVPAPLAFLRGVLCLNSSYRPVGHCAPLPADGWAQHPYTSGQGPFGNPPSSDDVTIGTLGRLVSALDRAAAAGAVRRGLPVYITEFGVQSTPNPYGGVSLARQAEYDAIAERIAWSNPRVASFSQYLLRDDHPRHGRVVGSQTGLETYRGRPKPSYDGFRLPLTVTRFSGGVLLWGLVRPSRSEAAVVGATGATGATGAAGAAGSPSIVLVQASQDGGRSWRTLLRVRVAADGSWSAASSYTAHRLWRAEWVAGDGSVYYGPPIRAYS